MATTSTRSSFWRGRVSRRQPDAWGVRAYSVAVICTFGVLLTSRLGGEIPSGLALQSILVFTAVATLADALKVRPWPDMSFSLSAPVVLAAAMVLQPAETAVVGFLATADIREWRREVPLSRALFNRSQVGLSAFMASAVFHALAGSTHDWPRVLLPAMLCLAADMAVNTSLVLWPSSRIHESSCIEVLRAMYGPRYVVTFARLLCVGLMAPLIVEVWYASGTTGLAVFLLPIALAWSVLRQAELLREASERLMVQDEALAIALNSVASERRDERLTIAGELHDDVLPAIYSVHLLGQVVRQDLADGRLLELELDVPRLNQAATHAQLAIRSMLTQARTSAIGGTGLAGAIRLLAERVEFETGTRVMTELDDIDGDEERVLVAFQIAREAIWNAAKHSGAAMVVVRLTAVNDRLILTVRDDGRGFDPGVYRPGHFGLSLMRERARVVGGDLVVDALPGQGATVSLTMRPVGETQAASG